jgi:hypothetical protein
MAKSTRGRTQQKNKTIPKRTSIGRSKNTRPKNKHKKSVGKNIEVKEVDEMDKNPVLSVVDGKMCINGKTFEHTELRESKEYLQSIAAEEAFFYPENEEELEELHEIIKKMGEISPEISGDEISSYYLN